MRFELQPNRNQKSFYGKAVVHVHADGSAVLISYNTPVCAIDKNGSFIRLWGGWSATTAKHVDAFRNLYGFRAINKSEWLKLGVKKWIA